MKVRKAIIPAAGLGTRLLPNTKSIPKEMLPLVDKPVLQYIVEEAVSAGVEEILIITNRGKSPIEDYFDYAPDLESRLMADGKEKEAGIIRAVADMADVYFVRQKETKGLGHAVWRAKSFVGNEPFAVLLGDDIMLSETPVLKQLVDAAERYKCSAIAIREFPGEEICKYSSVKLVEQLSERVYRIGDMNEKPTMEERLSNYAIMGRYVLTPAIFDILEHTAPGRNNEIQLTDGMRRLCHEEPMCAVDFEGKRYDTGNLKGYLESIIDFALKNEEAGDWLRQFIIDKAEQLKDKNLR
ncbi:MAG TPA: UTP--glucose-1-phosphate uridylyltransferase GalU [Candidatus Limivicinus faecipullorum]|nr:UTP--glucose-1-phosphate uridylyltransferase GalU [Candidatus Limivicinus faecipullorum]